MYRNSIFYFFLLSFLMSSLLSQVGCAGEQPSMPAEIIIHSYKETEPPDERIGTFTAIELDLEVKNLIDEVIFFEFEYPAGEFIRTKTIRMLTRVDNDEEANYASWHYGKPQIPPQLKAHTSARGPISIWVPGDNWQKVELIFICVNRQEREQIILSTQVINKADL